MKPYDWTDLALQLLTLYVGYNLIALCVVWYVTLFNKNARDYSVLLPCYYEDGRVRHHPLLTAIALLPMLAVYLFSKNIVFLLVTLYHSLDAFIYTFKEEYKDWLL